MNSLTADHSPAKTTFYAIEMQCLELQNRCYPLWWRSFEERSGSVVECSR